MPFLNPPDATNELDHLVTTAGDLSRKSTNKLDGVTAWLACSTGLDADAVYPMFISKTANLKVRFDQRDVLAAQLRAARRITGSSEMVEAIALCSRPAGGP